MADTTPQYGDEEALLAGLRSGEEAAYAHLTRKSGPRLFAVARRYVGNDADAADCVQEALVSAFRRIDTFEGRSALHTWLHRIVVNTALMHLRAKKRRPEGSIEELLPRFDEYGCRIEPAAPVTMNLLALVKQQEVRETVRRAIDELPDDFRIVLLLRDIEGYDTAETAEALDISSAAVKTRLHRARSALKHKLEPILARGDL